MLRDRNGLVVPTLEDFLQIFHTGSWNLFFGIRLNNGAVLQMNSDTLVLLLADQPKHFKFFLALHGHGAAAQFHMPIDPIAGLQLNRWVQALKQEVDDWVELDKDVPGGSVASKGAVTKEIFDVQVAVHDEGLLQVGEEVDSQAVLANHVDRPSEVISSLLEHEGVKSAHGFKGHAEFLTDLCADRDREDLAKRELPPAGRSLAVAWEGPLGIPIVDLPVGEPCSSFEIPGSVLARVRWLLDPRCTLCH